MSDPEDGADAARGDAPAKADIRAGQGVQVGDHNVQVNYFAEVVPLVPGGAPPASPGPRPPRVTVTIEAELADGDLQSRVLVGESVLCRRREPLAAEVAGVWQALRLPGLIAAQRMADAGRQLAGMLLDDAGQRTIAGLLRRLPPVDFAEVTLIADGPALALPVELVSLNNDGIVTGPLGLIPNVSVMRRVGTRETPPPEAPQPASGPLKILAAVAAPDETGTPDAPLDTEAEMAAVLEAVSGVAGGARAQVRILEVASPTAIRQALETDSYHVLHLSAHGSPDAIELEDEDGNPVVVTPDTLMRALKHGGRALPLIVLSSCSGGATGSDTMAAGLIAHGADRVIAMLAPVTDAYATLLARNLYHELAAHPDATVGQALARARHAAHEADSDRSQEQVPAPEYGVITLFSRGEDGPLLTPAFPLSPLTFATSAPTGRGVRELKLGQLIGRRRQLRDVMGVLRRTERAKDRFGAASGVVVTGIGGIGKTAVAGRAIARLRDEGWLVAVHEGRWNPAALINATAEAVAASPELARYAGMLASRDMDDIPKLALVSRLLAECRLLIVLDDFEQTLTVGGEAFLDQAAGEAVGGLARAAEEGPGALLVTCRHPLPGEDRFLVRVDVPPLSASELGRMFLRLPALRDLDPQAERLLMRAIGGHPRLIEFTDALLRGGRSSLAHVQRKLRDLARSAGVSLDRDAPLEAALDQAMLLGGADILLGELLTLLTERQVQVLRQVAVCHGVMALDDLAFALDGGREPADTTIDALGADVDRLTGLTLLTPGADAGTHPQTDIGMHPWVAALVARNATAGLARLHERALAMRYRRVTRGRVTDDDVIDTPRHLAALGRFDVLADYAISAVEHFLTGTLTICAYLAEVRSVVPEAELAWAVIVNQEISALLRSGALTPAAQLAHVLLTQIQRRVDADPDDAGWQRDLACGRDHLGDIARKQGDHDAAGVHYQAALVIRRRLADTGPGDVELQSDLAISHEKLGNLAVYLINNRDIAGTHHQAALSIRERLAEADPGDAERQHHLAVSHRALGIIEVERGNPDVARTHFEAALAIAHRFASEERHNPRWHQVLADSRSGLGDTAAGQGDLDAAHAHYLVALAIRRGLSDSDPGNAQWQLDLANSQSRLGDIAARQGDSDAARAHYQAVLAIRLGLSDSDPGNAEWQLSLTSSYESLGDIAAGQGDLDAARTHHQAAHAIYQGFVDADPGNNTWQFFLAFSHNRLGGIAKAQGDLTSERTHLQTAFAILQDHVGADLDLTRWRKAVVDSFAGAQGDPESAHASSSLESATQRLLSTSPSVSTMFQFVLAFRLGLIGREQDDGAATRTHFEAVLDIAERLAGADSATLQLFLAMSHYSLADIATAEGNLDAARTHYEAVLATRQGLAEADPDSTEWQFFLADAHDELGDMARAGGDLDTARVHYQAVFNITQRLADGDPGNTEWQSDLAFTRSHLGEIAQAQGDLDAARAHYLAGLAIRRGLAEGDPDNTKWPSHLFISYSDLKILATEFRDLGDAAKAAGDLDSARARYQGALIILEPLAGCDPANNHWRFAVAVIHCRLGDVAAANGDIGTARGWYEKSLAIRTQLAALDPSNAGRRRDVEYVQRRLGSMPGS